MNTKLNQIEKLKNLVIAEERIKSLLYDLRRGRRESINMEVELRGEGNHYSRRYAGEKIVVSEYLLIAFLQSQLGDTVKEVSNILDAMLSSERM